MTYRYALSLGSNLGDRLAFLQAAVTVLRQITQLEAFSRVYETPPMYVTDQPHFLNMTVIVETPLMPIAMLDAMKVIETDVGRTKSERRGPRQLDIDLVLAQDAAGNAMTFQHPRLHIPHELYRERAFVLYPLSEIAGSWQDPHTQQSVMDMCRCVDRGNTVLFMTLCHEVQGNQGTVS